MLELGHKRSVQPAADWLEALSLANFGCPCSILRRVRHGGKERAVCGAAGNGQEVHPPNCSRLALSPGTSESGADHWSLHRPSGRSVRRPAAASILLKGTIWRYVRIKSFEACSSRLVERKSPRVPTTHIRRRIATGQRSSGRQGSGSVHSARDI